MKEELIKLKFKKNEKKTITLILLLIPFLIKGQIQIQEIISDVII